MNLRTVFSALLGAVVLLGCEKSDTDFVRSAQKSVQQQLKDPESAQFGEAFVVKHPDGSSNYKKLLYVCGTVNGKNALGGYSGASRFVVLLGVPKEARELQVIDLRLEKSPGDEFFSLTTWDIDCKKI